MAGNAEKAAKKAETGENERRPHTASELSNLAIYVGRRLEIIQKITEKVERIQNTGLGELRTRDLNDEINRLLWQKRHLETHISDLGARTIPASFEYEGLEVPAKPGYMYFGAAKDLPGVREQLLRALPKKTGVDLMGDNDTDLAIQKALIEVMVNGTWKYQGRAATVSDARKGSDTDDPTARTQRSLFEDLLY
ncbi:pre-mRNA-splicing factor ISY1 homolog [Sabethes cyaneus]|uniref:pre-mRNA-splicing factor ISY1 homolog n=1 Tax=Sabethes cyaneus TaxID=53552 RepID=UPI00237DB30B|nr:pre-mRNA-splicing factor ISY1 homolog [Sabethes cyaneus]